MSSDEMLARQPAGRKRQEQRSEPDRKDLSAMNLHRWLAALLIMLALAACAQGGQVPYAPYSHEDKNDRGGDMM
jgi:hypothetical protein